MSTFEDLVELSHRPMSLKTQNVNETFNCVKLQAFRLFMEQR
jgi:hypothetical protein